MASCSPHGGFLLQILPPQISPLTDNTSEKYFQTIVEEIGILGEVSEDIIADCEAWSAG